MVLCSPRLCGKVSGYKITIFQHKSQNTEFEIPFDFRILCSLVLCSLLVLLSHLK